MERDLPKVKATSITPWNGVHPRQDISTASSAPPQTAPVDSPTIPGTDLAYDPDLVSADGKVPLILSGADPQALKELRKVCGKSVTDTLPLVNGVVSQMPLDRVAGLLSRLPAGTTVVPDHRLSFAEPSDIRGWEDQSGLGPVARATRSTQREEAVDLPPLYVPPDTSAEAISGYMYPHPEFAHASPWVGAMPGMAPFPMAGIAYTASDSNLVEPTRPGSRPAPRSPAQDVSSTSAPNQPAPPVDVDRIFLGLADLHKAGFTGKGVTIAVIDSGIYPHPELKDRITGWVDIASGRNEPYDSFGHGTNVAGIAAGDGRLSQGKLAGVAPEASIVGVRVETASEAIKGVQWVLENKDRLGIDVVNMSLGDTPNLSYKDDLWTQLVEKSIVAGLVVVVSAGNEGSNFTSHSISRPGIDPLAITVGAADLKGTLDTSDDIVAPFSSRGPTTPDELAKPDIVAPGVRIFGALAPNSRLDQPELAHVGRDYLGISGTSQATPIVAGAAALMLQANPKLTQAQIKDIIMQTARKYIKDDVMGQGAGMIDIGKAVQQAAAMRDQAAPAPTMLASAAPSVTPSVTPSVATSEWRMAT